MVATTPSLRLKIADRLPHRLENFPVTETSKPHSFHLISFRCRTNSANISALLDPEQWARQA